MIRCAQMLMNKANIANMIILCLLLCFSAPLWADSGDETMLMFVGEAEPVTTVASNQPESPLMAPAMVTLVDREQIERHGYRTLGELLADQPGFYMAPGGRGTVPYVRGLRDAILFLYDGVPITTDVTKSFAPLDLEFSLAPVDRVEIVLGSGSVLWGVDAFAAVVNIVPARAEQREGLHAEALAGNQHQTAGRLSWGVSGEDANLFLFATSEADKYYNDHYKTGPDEHGTVDKSHFKELVGTFQYQDWLHVSGRWSDFERNFTMEDAASNLVWEGTKETPFNYLKLSLTNRRGAAHYSLNGFLQETDYRLRDADTERRQRNRTGQLELLWDQRILQRGLLTTGASWRHNKVDGALVKDGFLPDFLQPDEPFFTPNLEQSDFNNDIYSVFGQFRYRFGQSEWWLGGRLEDHSEYDQSVTYNVGFQTSSGEDLHFKMVYGDAIRTPYSAQLFDVSTLKQEKIRTLSARMDWTPMENQRYSLTLFYSHIKHHRSEDPYGGLSLEQKRDLYGAELALEHSLTESLTAFIGLSLVDTDNGQEEYRYLAYSIIRPDGSREDVYEEWEQSYDQGPEWMARFSLDWSINSASNLLLTATAAGDTVRTYTKGTIKEHYNTPVLLSLTYNLPGFFHDHDHFTLRVTNLLDNDYQQPDIYGPVDGKPLTLTLLWQFDF